MIKRLAVLLLRIVGAPDLPTKKYAENLFTKVGKGTRNLVDYFDEMSHGRLDIGDSVVFDWIDYGHTPEDVADEWKKAKESKKKELKEAGASEAEADTKAGVYANGVGRGKIVEWAREAAEKNQYDIGKFDALICVFNRGIDYFGSPGRAVLNWNEADLQYFSIDLTGVSHEVGHALGFGGHSRLEGSAAEYGDRWDIMSAYSVDYGKKDSPYYTFGPGMNAVNMDRAGWLDTARVFTGGGTNHYSIRLRPLHRRDLPGWLAARVQIGYETVYIEFRMSEGWDANIPASCILLHRHSVHPGDGRPCSELLMANQSAVGGPRPDLRVGESYETGTAADPFGFYARITLTGIDRQNKEAYVNVSIREHRRIEPAGTLFGAVTSDGGGLVWTPGRGFVKVPPRSPLLTVLDLMAEAETLQTISRGEGSEILEQLALDRLTSARDHLSAMIAARKQPSVPGERLLSHRQRPRTGSRNSKRKKDGTR